MDPRSLFYSVSMHGGVILICWVTLSLSPRPKPLPYRSVPVQLVPLGVITASPKPVEAVKETPPAPIPQTPKVQKSSPKKEVPKTIKSPPLPTPKAPVLKKDTPPKKKMQTDAFEDVLKDVSNLKDAPKTDMKKGFESDLISNKISISELDALRQQIQGCWIVPPSMLSEKNLLVEVGVQLTQEGVVESLSILNGPPPQKGPIFQVAVHSIRQALKAPGCTPLRVPKGKYEQWKYCVLRFQPQGVV